MRKLKVIHKNGQLYIKKKLSKNEQINLREIQVLQENIIRGLMRPSFDGKKIVMYSAPDGISLHNYLKNVVTKNDFFIIFTQIIEAFNKIDKYKLNITNIVLNTNYIFINLFTKEVQFIYQPIFSTNISINLFSILYDILFQVKIDPNENLKEINLLNDSLRNMQYFSPLDIQECILKIYPSVYNQIKRESGIKKQEFTIKKDLNETTILDEEETTILEDEAYETTLLNDFEETTLLDNNFEETTLLKNETIKNFHIIRLKTFEIITINKPLFKIGKDAMEVDCFIDNPVISRKHAHIIFDNNIIYLRDNNSTNGTFINGEKIKGDFEVQVNEGDIITLGNEDFEVHIE